jgi:hypothetical protein
MSTANRSIALGSRTCAFPESWTQAVRREGTLLPAPASEGPPFREGFTDRSCANLSLLYQGVRLPGGAPSCLVAGQCTAT